jgi:heavy metal translocating P-type ATPase
LKYKIVSDLPQRIRLSCGRYAFSKEESFALAEAAAVWPGVTDARAGYLTGSIVICYQGDCREDLLRAVSDLRLSDLAPPGLETPLAIDTDFRERLYKTVLRRAVRLCLPVPVRWALTVSDGLSYVFRGLKSLRSGVLGVETLDASAVAVSILRGNFDTAASIMFLLGISELLEDYARRRAKNALLKSLAVNIDTVWVERDGREVSVPASALTVGDRVVVGAGQMIPVDGTVRAGEAGVNQASMTGEPLAALKSAGDSVFAGTVLEEGRIVVETRALPDESRIGRIVEMIERSETLKAGIQARSERLADKIVPYSFLLSAGVLLFTGDLTKAASVLLVDYSCAIKLSTPVAVISAMREAAGERVLVKGGKFLENMAEADTVVFDKTGTLTVASPQVSKVIPFAGHDRDEVLRTAACLEEHFPHTVAQAVVRRAYDERLLHEEEHAEVEYVVAHGIATAYKGRRVIIGSRHFVEDDEGVFFAPAELETVEKEAGGDSVLYLAREGKLMGFICVSDPPRPEASEVIAALRREGIKHVVMLTGDSETTARATAEALGIADWRSQVLPEDKAAIITSLKAEGRKVIMVGDGVNDSPALAAADVSVAMKDASDVARETADITLLRSDLRDLVAVRQLSARLMRRIRGNFRFIIVFNSALLALGLSGAVSPNTSAVLHNVSTIAVSAASARKLRPAAAERIRGDDSVNNT